MVFSIFGFQTGQAQGTGSIAGQVTDPSSSVVPNAAVQVIGGGLTKNAVTDSAGRYSVTLVPGEYTIHVSAPGFVDATKQNVAVAPGQPATLDVALQIAASAQQVDVEETGVGTVNVEPSNNASALVVDQSDMDALPDDPDDLEAELTALAGPAAGPNGAQLFVDGFSGGQMPPKSSIREIRINSNPFAAEFDRPGFGRIQILTRPGTDLYHLSGFVTYGNKDLDTRNPFVVGPMPAYNNDQESASASGPLGKKFSWFIDFSDRHFNNSSLINSTTLNPSTLAQVPLVSTYATPWRSWSLNPRLDYAINQNNTLVMRYARTTSFAIGGVGGFSLPSQVTDNVGKYTTIQGTETMVIGTKAVSELRFQLDDSRYNTNASGFGGPTISVSGAFTGGGATAANFNRTRNYELQENDSITEGAHALKFGVRLRDSRLSVQSTSNYNGTYSFQTPDNAETVPCLAGITNPTSMDVYQQTELLMQQGVPMPTILAEGCGPDAFTLNSGPALFSTSQFDAGLYGQDDWRLRPGLTLSGGLRYEMQTNIYDKADFAPRAAISWAPGSTATVSGKTIFRGGWGVFYDRFPIGNVLNTIRYNGEGQQDYNITSTSGNQQEAYAALAYFGTTAGIPPLSLLAAANQPVYETDSRMKASYMMQSSASVERSLPGRTSVSLSLTDSRGVHDMRLRSINTFLPGTYDAATDTGVLPHPGQGSIYLYENTGLYKELQAITSVNSRLNSHISVNGYYAFSEYHTDTFGFPSNQYDTSVDWGRASGVPLSSAYMIGSIGLPLKVVVSPSISASSATPVNITTGTDLNGDGIFNDRPSFAPEGAVCGGNIVCTRYGNFNVAPPPGAPAIPINYADGSDQYRVDMRFSRTWGWGESRNISNTPPPANPGSGDRFGGWGTIPATNRRYNIGMTIAATDVLNHVNLSNPIGRLNSPYFGESLNTSAGGAMGTRRIQLTLRFTY